MSESKSDVFLSKTLSWLLRHAAAKEGLALSSEGFISVQEVLNHRKVKGKFSLGDIKRVVANNDKQRFCLRESKYGVLEIRANQGHSLPVDNLELVPILDSKAVPHVIHGTFLKNLDNIKKEGLSCMTRNHIHFSYDLNVGIRRNAQVFIYINLEKALSDGLKFFKSANGVILSPDSKMYNKQVIMCKICRKRVFANVWKMHVMGKKHLHLTPKKIRVSVSADKSNINEIHDYFNKFGTLGSKEVISCENGKVVIDYSFQSRTVHSLIIYKEHHLFHEPVKITWEEVDTPLPTPSTILPTPRERSQNFQQKGNKKDAELSTQTVLNNIKSASTFNEQMSVLLKNLQVDRESLEQKKKMICEDISSALAPMFAVHRICFFGSSVTHLDTQISDLDIYIENVREDSRPELGTLKMIRHLIFKCRKFCDVLLISGAKIPIIKCIHTKTQICCDLNIRNKLSVCNSELIRYYINLDDKLPLLMMMVKFWADCYDLKKVNYFSSYALYMMVIFYLQQMYNLPSVRDLQKNVKPDLVDGWNCAFEKLQFTSQTLRDESILNLVLGFFKFYSNFDYISKVISPYNGKIISKSSFIKPYELPEGFEIYENHKDALSVSSGICIQDPFELARNVAASVSLQCSGRFMAMCQLTLQLLREEEEKQLLYNVLTQKSDNYVFSVFKTDIDEQTWQQNVKKKMAKVLTDALNVTIVRQRNSNPFMFKCIGEKNIWENRVGIYKNLLTQLSSDTNSVQREIAATKCITKYFPQTLPVFFTVELNFKESRVDFILKQSSKKSKNFFHAAHFFYVHFLALLSIDENSETEKQDVITSEAVIKEEIDVENKTMTEVDIKVEEDETGKNIDSNENQEGDEKTAKSVIKVPKTEESDIVDEQAEDEVEDEEDVPPDFFDDFSNQDFMDGLDIVDAWDDDKPPDEVDARDKEKKPHSPIRYIESSERRKRHVRSNSKSPKRRKRCSASLTRRIRSKSREKVRMERRDPEKTRRDINRDKIKCARDKELKLVNDKLRIVETGLVPPGTEMEVDLNTILKEKEKERKKENSRSIERSRDTKIRSKDRENDRERRNVDTRERRLLEHERDRRINERERDRRPLWRSSSRERELRELRKRSPSPFRGRPRERELVYRSKKRTSSIDSNLSDREKWIRRSKRTRTRSRSKSPRRKNKKYEEEKRKKTFLEEIRDKLNETRPSASVPYQMQYPNPVPVPGPIVGAPAPVPAPSQYFSPVQQYDQNFFIGETYQTGFNNAIGNTGNAIPTQAPVVRAPPAPLINPQTLQLAPNKINILSDILLKPNEKKDEKETKEDIDKLFADKKISLSDFLTITAKCEVQSSSPEHLQKKIKVISRCQDAIKALSDDRKLSGRLSVKPTEQSKSKNEVKYQSPLRRIPIVRFQFTSPPKITEDMDSFAIAMDKVLRSIGVLKGEAEEENIAKLASSSYADEETAALSLKVNILKKSEQKECEECKKRKAKVFVEVGSQCMDIKETVDVAVQVIEEEINPKPKNESLALLTPAQLLGKEKDKEEKTTKAEPEKEEIIQSPVKAPPKIHPFMKGRGGFRNTLRDRSGNNNYYEEEEYEYHGRGRPVMNPREGFGRYGGPPGRFGRGGYNLEDHNMRIQQFRDQEDNFMDFTQPFRGRGGRFPYNRY